MEKLFNIVAWFLIERLLDYKYGNQLNSIFESLEIKMQETVNITISKFWFDSLLMFLFIVPMVLLTEFLYKKWLFFPKKPNLTKPNTAQNTPHMINEQSNILSLKDALAYMESKHGLLGKDNVQEMISNSNTSPETWCLNFYLPYLQDIIFGEALLFELPTQRALIPKNQLPSFREGDSSQKTFNRFSKNLDKLLNSNGEAIYKNISISHQDLDNAIEKLKNNFGSDLME